MDLKRWLERIVFVAIICLLAWHDATSRKTVESTSKDVKTTDVRLTETHTAIEETTRKPDGTVIVRKEKTVENVKDTSKTAVKEVATVQKGVTNANRYSLGIHYRDFNRDWVNDLSGHLLQPEIELGRRVGESGVWGLFGYDIGKKDWYLGLRMEF